MQQTDNILNSTPAPSGEAVLTVEHLSISFGGRMILNDLNLDLHEAENLVIMGKSGAGKSVLIKCIVGLLTPDQGTVYIGRDKLVGSSYKSLKEIRRKIGFLFQGGALYDSMTVRENLEFPLRRHQAGLNKNDINQRVTEALEDVGLLPFIDDSPRELSGGMRKRVALARTLILRPEIILYDEPTTGLDSVTGKEIIDLINSIRDKYKTSSVIITHDMNSVKINSDRILLLLNGTFYAEGSYAEMKESSDPNIHQFFI